MKAVIHAANLAKEIRQGPVTLSQNPYFTH
jgi:hypothetical protein